MAFNNSTGVYTPATGATSAAAGATIASATWNSINNDYANNMRATGLMQTTITGVNLNSLGDNTLTVALPTGYSNYLISNLFASNASAIGTTAGVGLWTGAGATGVNVVLSGAVTLNPGASVTAQQFSIANQFTKTLSATSLFFRVLQVQGGASTCSVTVQYLPVS